MTTRRKSTKSAPDSGTVESAGIRGQAQGYGAEALETLVTIMNSSSSEPSRIAAAKEILERAYGKPVTPSAEEQAAPAEMTIRYVNDWRGEGEP